VLPDGVPVADNSLVKVVGTFKVSTYDKKDGSQGVSIRVNAKDVSAVVRGGRDAVNTIKNVLGAELVEDDGLPF